MTSPTLKSTPVDYPSLAHFDIKRLQAAASQWVAIQTQLQQVIDDYEKSVLNPVTGSGWTGDAATKATASIQQTHAKLVATLQYVDSAVDLLNAAADGMQSAQDYLLDAASKAGPAGCTLEQSTGNITDFDGAKGNWDTPAVLAAMDLQQAIYEARYSAFVTNGQVGPALSDSAKQFGSSDSGSWQANAASHLDTAQSIAANLPKTLATIQAAPPAVPGDTAAVPYHVQSPTGNDQRLHALMLTGGLAYLGVADNYPNATYLLAHWLHNSGDPAKVKVPDMMNDMSRFRATVTALGANEGVSAKPWDNFHLPGPSENGDWFYAFGDFRFRVVALQMVDESEKRHAEFAVGVKKPYVFHPDGKPVGPIHLSQAKIAHLHTVGLAQNFIAEGIMHFTY